MNVSLRPLEDRDLDTIYHQVTDPESIRMAAFTAEDQTDRSAFLNRTSRLRADTSVSHRVIDVDGAVAGTIGSFRIDNRPEVTYWVDRTQWGKGIALTSLIQEDAKQSMPPYDLWLRGRDDILKWWFGPGAGCRGSRVIPTSSANGSPAFGQYKPSASGSGYDPWALQVIELSEGRIVEFTFFLDTETLFPLFGLPARLDA